MHFRVYVCIVASQLAICVAAADEVPLLKPVLLGAQYTFVDQRQDALHSPYAGERSLRADGDVARSHTFGAYFGMQASSRLAMYLDVEMFRGEGVSDSTGMGGLPNGDVIHGGGTLPRHAYVARVFATYDIPLGDGSTAVKRKMDQLPGHQPTDRLQLKGGLLAVSDDFDKSSYAGSARTQFLNWSFQNSPAWDFAANTRGYTMGGVVTLVKKAWTVRYGVYQMPSQANGDHLQGPLSRARGDNLEVVWQPDPDGISLRVMGYRNTARMGIYRDAIAAAPPGGVPDIVADDKDGRHKRGFAVGMDLPLADDGDTGWFIRAARNDGRTESFAFTEADASISTGLQIAGRAWGRRDDRIGIAFAQNRLSPDHRDYLKDGGVGFVLGDGNLRYARRTSPKRTTRWP
ncbi:hypothetical protein FHW69_002748 [Luteibacter sp. Sphag1AF]|uniref:carbohydrate porin n=1 Tax=Luteibacter sp. Sphag1AF TaxID=2587031 RepID=UPI00161B1576|nr:carbohydrate porin [Luteibacter sp. Sphag1AF]MBB3228113.1 hypothetical protein [Luteibacter sp. Sphag1AF]